MVVGVVDGVGMKMKMKMEKKAEGVLHKWSLRVYVTPSKPGSSGM
ncbi:hypothetical protein Tco_0667662, partial [Tanacetum coccineum]